MCSARRQQADGLRAWLLRVGVEFVQLLASEATEVSETAKRESKSSTSTIVRVASNHVITALKVRSPRGVAWFQFFEALLNPRTLHALPCSNWSCPRTPKCQ